MNDRPQINPWNPRASKYLSGSRIRYIAQSILHGLVDDPLPSTEEEARDIIKWHQSAPNSIHNYAIPN